MGVSCCTSHSTLSLAQQQANCITLNDSLNLSVLQFFSAMNRDESGSWNYTKPWFQTPAVFQNIPLADVTVSPRPVHC